MFEAIVSAVSRIDVVAIWELPWSIKGPGLFLIALLIIRAIRALFSLRLITMFISLVYAFVLAILLMSMGPMLALMIENNTPATDDTSSIQHFQDFPGNSLS